MKEETPVPYDVPKVSKPPKTEEVVKEEVPVKEAQSEVAAEIEHEVEIPVVQKREEPRVRKLYDTVNVTYENEDDDFSDIRNMMNGKGVKSPTHFSE